MSLVLNESLVLAKTRSQDLKSVLRLNCWGSGIKDVSLVRELINVEVIGLSCNEVTSLRDFAYCKNLKELILRKNKVQNISEISHLQGLPKLTNLWLEENPCVDTTYNYRKVVIRALPQLKVLDNKPITREELLEIEELGDEIYEEITYESTGSAGSGPPSNTQSSNTQSSNQEPKQQSYAHYTEPAEPTSNEHLNESSFFAPTQTLNDSQILNDTVNGVNHMSMNESIQNKSLNASSMPTQTFHNQSSRCLLSQGLTNCNNNNNILPKGGKSRKGNILSAVLCLIKELDYTSCEVVQTALHCQMEETSQ